MRSFLKKITIKDKVKPESIAGWFFYCEYATEINNLENIDTSICTDMRYAFYNVSKVKKLDLHTFDTSNVEKIDNFIYSYAEFQLENRKGVFMPTVARLLRAQLVADQEDVDIVNAVIYDEKASEQYKTQNIETHYKQPFYLGGHYETVDGEQVWTGSYVRTADESKLLYWDIFKLDDAENAEKTYSNNDTETRANLRVAQCYSLKFNYVGFEDYYVRAVYAAAGETVPDRQEQS